MNLVTDTHALVWYLSGDLRRLSLRARRAFLHADAGRSMVYVPTLVLMEILLLEQRGRIRVSYGDLREQLSIRPGFPVEPLTAEDVDEARALGTLRDPFDRLIAATARRLRLPLITSDSLITDSGLVSTHW